MPGVFPTQWPSWGKEWDKFAETSFGTSSTTKDGKTLGRDFCLYCVLVFYNNDNFASVINYGSMFMALTLPHHTGHLNFLQRNQSRLVFLKSSTPVSLSWLRIWMDDPSYSSLPIYHQKLHHFNPFLQAPLTDPIIFLTHEVFLTQSDYFPPTFLPLPDLLCHIDIAFSFPSHCHCRIEEHWSRDLAVCFPGG